MDNEFVKGADELVQKLNQINKYVEKDVPVVVGVEAVNHFKESFTNEGFTDKSFVKWQERKSKRFGSTNSQPILSQSGELADSIDFRIEGDTVVIYTDKPYAEIHNEGGTIEVTAQMKKYFWSQWHMAKEMEDEEMMSQFKAMALAKQIKIQQRQFIGESEALNQRITDKILRELQNIVNR
jgi:phage gpG-like protein